MTLDSLDKALVTASPVQGYPGHAGEPDSQGHTASFLPPLDTRKGNIFYRHQHVSTILFCLIKLDVHLDLIPRVRSIYPCYQVLRIRIHTPEPPRLCFAVSTSVVRKRRGHGNRRHCPSSWGFDKCQKRSSVSLPFLMDLVT